MAASWRLVNTDPAALPSAQAEKSHWAEIMDQSLKLGENTMEPAEKTSTFSQAPAICPHGLRAATLPSAHLQSSFRCDARQGGDGGGSVTGVGEP